MAGIFKFCPKSMGHFCLLNQQVSELNTWNTQMQLKEYVDCFVFYMSCEYEFLFCFDLICRTGRTTSGSQLVQNT